MTRDLNTTITIARAPFMVLLVLWIAFYVVPHLVSRVAVNSASLQVMLCCTRGETGAPGEQIAALERWPTNNDLLRLQGILSWRQGDYSDAAAKLGTVKSPDAIARFYLARALFDSGQQDDAIQLYRELDASNYFVGSDPDLALEISPDDVDLLYRLGESAKANGRPRQASAYFSQALSQDTVVSQRSLLSKAFVYESQERWADAENTYRRAIDLYPYTPAAYRYLGNMYHLKLGNGTLALEWYDRAIALPQSCYLSCLWAGDLLIGSQPARALEYFLRSVKLSSPNPTGWTGVGLAQISLGLYTNAIHSLERAKQELGGKLLPPISYGLGKAHLELGEWETAIDYLRRSLSDGNHAADAYLSLTTAYSEGGRCADADATTRAFLEIEPVDPRVHAALLDVSVGCR